MSYKYTVLQDKPMCFYMLDEVRSGDIGSYTSVISQFATYQDLKDNLSSYSALSGLPVFDYSGNAFDGYAIDSLNTEIVPLIAGGIRGTQISGNTKVVYKPYGIASSKFSDDAFTIECWVKLFEFSSNDTCIIGDIENNIGIFFKNGNIEFRVDDTYFVSHTVEIQEALHVVASFNSSSISLYINGTLVQSKSLPNYKFINNLVEFQSGPTIDKFIIDAVCFYRFNLSNIKIAKHYFEGSREIKYSQIAGIDGGYLFSLNLSAIKPVYEYAIPGTKKWADVADSNISISDDGSYIFFDKTDSVQSKSFEYIETIFVPTYLDIISSQISYSNNSDGVTLSVSLDKNIWVECKNGMPLPYINKTDNQIADLIFLKISMNTSDSSKLLPILKNINIKFYSNKDCYGDNSTYKISSEKDYGLSEENYRIIACNNFNGLRMYNGGGFNINSNTNIRTVELFFSPDGLANTLISSGTAYYGWNGSGTISKNGVSSIYVNGKDVTSESNTASFLVNGIPHHIVLVFSSNKSSEIYFNQKPNGSSSGFQGSYNNIALYPFPMTLNMAINHYYLYTDRITSTVYDTGFTALESNTGTNSTAYTALSVEPIAISI